MAEHGLDGPVIGVAFDGTGYGRDGTAWGGEVLVADYRTCVRFGTCRAIPLAGGDAAIRQPWRIALAVLEDAFDGDPPIDQLPLFETVAGTDVSLVREMVRRAVNAPLAHGMGRYFDAFGALALARPVVSFEGQLALAFNVVADPAERGWYPWELAREGEVLQLDFRRAVRQVAFEVIGRAPVELMAARFHNTIAAATAELVRTAARRHRGMPVVLSGGCFQNARLTEALVDDLSPQLSVHTHRQVPPGDGGLALGQAVVAGCGR
jgi:hydrogenase maturation protein HypF